MERDEWVIESNYSNARDNEHVKRKELPGQDMTRTWPDSLLLRRVCVCMHAYLPVRISIYVCEHVYLFILAETETLRAT